MRIFVDEAVPGAPGLFTPLGDVICFEGRRLTADDLRRADALVVRSVTRVGPDLLQDTPIRFVGTATSGLDHIDVDYLHRAKIHFADAAGCNSHAVADFVFSALFTLAAKSGFDPAAMTLGVVGCGRIGSLVARIGRQLNMRVLRNDPPLHAAGRLQAGVTLEQIAAEADILSLHVPLTAADPFPTRGLINADILSRMKPGAILINTSRGEITEEIPLFSALKRNRLIAVLDVWQCEPCVNPDHILAATLATPHIAGYAFEARRRAAEMMRDALARWSGLTCRTRGIASQALPEADAVLDASHSASRQSEPIRAIADVLARILPLAEADAQLREAASAGAIERAFDAIRRRFADRHEFTSIQLECDEGLPARAWDCLRAMGLSRSQGR